MASVLCTRGPELELALLQFKRFLPTFQLESMQVSLASPRPNGLFPALVIRTSYNSEMSATLADAARVKADEASRLFDAGQIEEALLSLNKAIFLQPEDPKLHEQRAQIYCELGDVRSAMASYRKLLAIQQDPPPRVKAQFAALLDLHAYTMLILGDAPSIAIAYLTEAIDLDALTPVYWLHRSIAHINAGSFDRALEDVDHCICLDGSDVEYFVLRAKLHWRLHMHDKATKDILRAAKLRPDHPEVLEHEQRLLRESQAIYERACKQLLSKDFVGAIQCLTSAICMAPDEPKFYLLRAAANRALGEYHVALKDVDHAAKCHRHKLEAFTANEKRQLDSDDEYGAASERNNTDNGVPADTSKQYQEIASQRCLILNDLAQRFLREKSYQLALNAMNQVIRAQRELCDLTREPFSNPQHYRSRGDAYRGLGNLHAALADYHRALDIFPEAPEMRSRIGHIHYSFGIELFNRAQFDRAELEFSRAIEFDNQVSAYYIRRGDAARYQEKHEQACADYSRALQLDPRSQGTKDKLRQYSVSPPPFDQETRGRSNSSGVMTGKTVYEKHMTQQTSKLADARVAYDRRNKLVQDLFLHRPSLPSVKKPSSH